MLDVSKALIYPKFSVRKFLNQIFYQAGNSLLNLHKTYKLSPAGRR